MRLSTTLGCCSAKSLLIGTLGPSLACHRVLVGGLWRLFATQPGNAATLGPGNLIIGDLSNCTVSEYTPAGSVVQTFTSSEPFSSTGTLGHGSIATTAGRVFFRRVNTSAVGQRNHTHAIRNRLCAVGFDDRCQRVSSRFRVRAGIRRHAGARQYL